MDFDLSEEQRLLKESLKRLLGDHYAFEQRKSYGQFPEGWSRDLWARYAELGLLGLPFPDSSGGSGGGPVETMIAMEAFGRALTLEPFFATVALGGGFLRHGGTVEQCAELVPKIAGGSVTLAFAQTERRSRYDLADIETRAVRAVTMSLSALSPCNTTPFSPSSTQPEPSRTAFVSISARS